MNRLSNALLVPYKAQLPVALYPAYRTFVSGQKGADSEDFSYYLLASSVFSSQIEGVSLDLNSFLRNRNTKSAKIRKEVAEIEGLIQAYELATTEPLTLKNVLKAHKKLAGGLSIEAHERGRFRQRLITVQVAATRRPVYVAVEPEYVEAEMNALFADVSALLSRQLSYDETFFYAAQLHLWLAMIHPFADGNGRSARLVEKWFLTQKLGPEAWGIRSEKYYWDHRPDYYRTIALGLNYYVLRWERSLEFLQLLPAALVASTAVSP